MIVLFTVLGLLTAAYVVYALQRSAGRVDEQRQTVVTEQALTQVSDPLARLCAEDAGIRARVGVACDTASVVASAPPDEPAAGLDGRNGIDGKAGRDGINGRDGVDGVSPPCLATVSQCVGADGKDGVDGKDGADGKPGQDGTNGTNGRDGSPATELIVNRSDGTQLRCPRTGGEDTAPVYTCSAA